MMKISKPSFSFIRECKVNGKKILLNISNRMEWCRARSYSTKEPDTLKWINSFSPGDVLFDVGANIGVYSLYAGKFFNEKVKVFAFEPESLNYARLNQNIFINKLQDTIIPYCLAIDDKTRFETFYISDFINGASQHSFNNKIDVVKHKQGMIGVSMDDLVFEFGFDFPTHIKIDVDGNETLILNGMKKVLMEKKLKTVLIEINDLEESKRVIDIFGKYDFYLSKIDIKTNNHIFRR